MLCFNSLLMKTHGRVFKSPYRFSCMYTPVQLKTKLCYGIHSVRIQLNYKWRSLSWVVLSVWMFYVPQQLRNLWQLVVLANEMQGGFCVKLLVLIFCPTRYIFISASHHFFKCTDAKTKLKLAYCKHHFCKGYILPYNVMHQSLAKYCFAN